MKIKIQLMTLILLIVLGVNCTSSDLTYEIETIDGVKFIHNNAPLWGDEPKIKLEFVRNFGETDSKDENYWLFKPIDAVYDNNGNVYILENGNNHIKKFSREGEYILTIGKKGRGPGELGYPIEVELLNDTVLVVSDIGNSRIHFFSTGGKFLESHRVNKPIRSFKILNDSTLVVKRANISTDNNITYLLQHQTLGGEILKLFCNAPDFGARRSIQLELNKLVFTKDQQDYYFIALKNLNEIRKYSPNGKLLLKFDRPLNFKAQDAPYYGQLENPNREPIEYVIFNAVSEYIQVDHKDRIWVMTARFPIGDYLKDPESFKDKEEIYIFDYHIFNSGGVFLGSIPNISWSPNMTINGDRLLQMEDEKEMVVKEYRIVDMGDSKK